MKHSLILHPPGARYVRIDLWVNESLGGKAHAEAACLSQIEHWQRNLPPGEDWVKRTIDDFIEALGGLYGKDIIGKALRKLKDAHWIDIEKNIQTTGNIYLHETKYRLNFSKINGESEKYQALSKNSDFSPPEKSEITSPGFENNSTISKNSDLSLLRERKIVSPGAKNRFSGDEKSSLAKEVLYIPFNAIN